MTTVSAPPKKPKSKHPDPETYRMTVGEHLEELRWRLILALIGLFVAVLICLPISERVLVFFCAPLVTQMLKHGISPQLFYVGITDIFMTYIKFDLIGAAAIAGPWMLYQIWQFVAAGLYPNERKMVTRYIPLSITLLITGFVFVYVVVLPLTIAFFLEFSSGLPMPAAYPHNAPVSEQTTPPSQVPVLRGDPAHPRPGELWVNEPEGRLKVFVAGKMKVIPFGPESLVAPVITLPDYMDLVLTFMLTFGLSFQLPLVILALVKVGIVDVAWLKKQRKMVYFGMTVAAAFLAPGDIVTSMLALLIPLIVLYEFGIWLVRFNISREPDAR